MEADHYKKYLSESKHYYLTIRHYYKGRNFFDDRPDTSYTVYDFEDIDENFWRCGFGPEYFKLETKEDTLRALHLYYNGNITKHNCDSILKSWGFQ